MLIELAADSGVRKTAGSQPTPYELPLTVTVNRWSAVLSAFGLGGIGAMAIVAAWIALSGRICWPSSASETVAFLVAAPLLAWGGVFLGPYCLISSAVILMQAFQRAPALVIDSEGVHDPQGQWSAPWTTISRLHADRTDFGGRTVRLRLRRPCEAAGAGIRTSTVVKQLWRRRADERFVAIEGLSVRARSLIRIMSIMVQNHGGETDASFGPQDRIVGPA